MLRYRVAFDPDRGHFVLPTLPAVVHPDQTYASRAAAQEIAERENLRRSHGASDSTGDALGASFLRVFLRRASA